MTFKMVIAMCIKVLRVPQLKETLVMMHKELQSWKIVSETHLYFMRRSIDYCQFN